MGENLVDHSGLGNEGDDVHLVCAPRTPERVDLKDPAQQLRPAAAGFRERAWHGLYLHGRRRGLPVVPPSTPVHPSVPPGCLSIELVNVPIVNPGGLTHGDGNSSNLASLSDRGIGLDKRRAIARRPLQFSNTGRNRLRESTEAMSASEARKMTRNVIGPMAALPSRTSPTLRARTCRHAAGRRSPRGGHAGRCLQSRTR